MPKIISHRGNLNGPNKETENTKKQIQLAFSSGFEIEIDVWYVDGKFFLGHDEPKEEIDIQFLDNYCYALWIHCKNIEALSKLKDYFNAFGHSNDDYVLTSKGYIWVYPERKLVKNSIAVLPETTEYETTDLKNCYAVCTDNPIEYREKMKA